MTVPSCDVDSRAHPLVAEMRAMFRAHHSFSRDIVDRAVTLFGARWADDCEETLATLFPTLDAQAQAVKGYAAFAWDSMRRQAKFERDRAYPAKTYAAAADEVYFNPDYMASEYLPGLLLSHFLWPHHYRQLSFFDSAFIEPMRTIAAASFMEVGVGTGLYSRRLLQNLPDLRGVGIDISPSSKLFADRHMQAFGMSDRYEIRLQDILDPAFAAQTDWLVCVEVLEHLEDPVAFLRGLRRALAPGGRAFITAALNAASPDHIYLYRTADEVWAQLDTAGFALEQSFLGAAYRPSAPGVPVPLAAAFVVV
ncbi:MAG: 2-polyprenyl-3-methyl-5-hydroxy-6-metoxy,4-benzoquinol methylase [Rhodospirillales bacterium]|nr:2-polyprenyl-3-methyl-5-hydroxy-6-metoxy,4-benzoquinol methylase [Rhodospirillales bacterium]